MNAEHPLPADAAQRAEALDTQGSFIVQAPAGSGKTELLIQRYLKLLTQVDAPEEVVAITFTRKAAGEMRGRVLDALTAALAAADAEDKSGAGRGSQPDGSGQPHERITRELARAAMERDARLGWNIADTPARLRIQTIDALCAAITRQMPWLSRFGGQPASVEDAAHLHQDAARATLARLEPGRVESDGRNGGGGAADTAAAVAVSVEKLLAHLDNNPVRAAGLLQTMLARRDQWLRHIDSGDPTALRAELERVLASVAEAAMGAAEGAMPAPAWAQLPALAAYAAENLSAEKPGIPLMACRGITQPPGTLAADLPIWKGLTDLLLTGGGAWRKSVTKTQGFPAPASAESESDRERFQDMKGRMEELLGGLRNDGALLAALTGVVELPPTTFPDGQWEVLEALLTLLPLAVGELRRVFAEAGEIDFTGVSLSAVAALEAPRGAEGTEGTLDYRIRHLLVDEFQDTSFSQYRLLERLTAGWRNGDGRTLFLVGDPMQSIYRFREADVSLYLRARRDGMGDLALSPLTLSVNFRSRQGIVDWINDAFPRVLPEAEDALTGAVAYSPSEAWHPTGVAPAVQVHPWLGRNDEEEARRVVALVRQSREELPGGEVAILVRSRSHLTAILPALKAAGLAYHAVDIDPLQSRPAVQDLLALTRALHHPADRVAWLALLRAPWCGLELAHLLALAGGRGDATIWSCITRPGAEDALGPAGGKRLARVREVMAAAMQGNRGDGMRRLVEGTWIALGGPATLEDDELGDARAFLELLEELDEDGAELKLQELQDRAARLYAPPDPGAGPELQIMSIHKAKGLQFDTVILPGLGRAPARDEPRLLLWTELPGGDGGKGGGAGRLLLAPISEAGESRDPIYQYLAGLNRKRDTHETGRLLYVAVTRARHRVHLLGHSTTGDEGVRPPHSGTLLRQLWPVLEPKFTQLADDPPQPVAAVGDTAGQGAADGADGPGTLRRLAEGWTPPPAPESVAGAEAGPAAAHEADGGGHAPEFLWAGDTARHVGTVVHRILQRIAGDGSGNWSGEAIARMHDPIEAGLARLGVPQAELAEATAKAERALVQTLADDKGGWLLAPHTQADSELALTAMLDGAAVRVIIDRTFVDEGGTRWIVDYKTGSHQGGDLAAFLDNEQKRYRAQLEDYARVMRKYDPSHPIRVALYCPLLQAFREWTPETESTD